MKRKLKTFALFERAVLRGRKLPSKYQSIYRKLLNIGFQETSWQFVYEGQIAGLVIPYRSGVNEIHIRFYEDRWFAELEVGRAQISHFFGPQYNAKNLVKELVGPTLTADEFQILSEQLDKKLRSDEEELELWDRSNHCNPYATLIGEHPNVGRIFFRHFAGLGWNTIACITIGIMFFVLLGSSSYMAWVSILALSVIAGTTLPTIGKP